MSTIYYFILLILTVVVIFEKTVAPRKYIFIKFRFRFKRRNFYI